MILAAGRGTRLLPRTETVPKALIPVLGKPMIHHALWLFRTGGVREVIINLHHLGEMIERALGDGTDFGLRIHYSREETLLDTGGGIQKARPFLEDGTFLVINCDFIAKIDLREVVRHHAQKGATATLVLRDDPQVERYGPIETDQEGRICRILARGNHGVRKRMFAGMQVLEPRVFSFMPYPAPFSITRDTYPLMLQQGEALWGYEFSGSWFDLGTPEGIRDVEAAQAGRPGAL